MITFKCKMCGGDLNITEGNPICECEFCGTTQTIPTADNEKKTNLFNRANRLRMNAEFDKAATVYASITAEFPEEAEAYWGLCLCKYGIEYVDDPATGKKIPTCHRTLPASILDDSDFEQACENADPIAKKVYREEAKAIDRLQQDILSIVASEAPYDVFICYKETDENGERTQDSVMAQDIYDSLTDKGLKVFFARITLEDKLGQQYEPYIYAALHSAKVMLAVGTQFEYFDAVWVKNEWARFLDMMKTDKSKTLIPCYKDIDAYDMPREFKNLQGQDMSKLGWLQDLTRGVFKLCGLDSTDRHQTSANTIPDEDKKLTGYVSMAQNALKAQNYAEVETYCNKILEIDFENVIAWKLKGYAALHDNNRINESCTYFINAYDKSKNKKETAEEIISECERITAPIFKEVVTNWRKNIADTSRIEPLYLNTADLYKKLNSHMRQDSNCIDEMANQLENTANDVWKIDVYNCLKVNNNKPDYNSFNQFLNSFSYPIQILELATKAESVQAFDNIRRLKQLINWAIIAKNAKSWHFQTEDEALSHLTYEARQGVNRIINLKLYPQKWVVDHVLSDKSTDYWSKKINEWEHTITKENERLERQRIEIQEEKERKNREQQERVVRYWNDHAEVKQKLDEELKELNKNVSECNNALKQKNNEKRIIHEKVNKDLSRWKTGMDENIDQRISRLKDTRASLGVFKGREKKQIDDEIASLMMQKPDFSELEKKKKEIEEQVRPILTKIIEEEQSLQKTMSEYMQKIKRIENILKTGDKEGEISEEKMDIQKLLHTYGIDENGAKRLIDDAETVDECKDIIKILESISHMYNHSAEDIQLCKEKLAILQKQEDKEQEALEFKKRGVCQYCGGEFIGVPFMGDVCNRCGKQKDY